MATSLKTYPQYIDQPQLNPFNQGSQASGLINLVSEFHSEAEKWDIQAREIKNERINVLKVKFFEERIVQLESGKEALAVKTFDEARRLVLTQLAGPGDNIISFNSHSILWDRSLTIDENIEIRIPYNNELSALKHLIDENTKAIYLETIGDDFSIPDFQKISAIAKSNNIPLVVDNTEGAAGFVSAPLRYGANVLITNTSAFLNTFDSFIGAAIIDGGNFNWENSKFNLLKKTANFESVESNELLLINHLRALYKVNYKQVSGPDEALQLVNEIEGLPHTLKSNSSIALDLSKWLYVNKVAEDVQYVGLPLNKNYLNGLRYLRNGFGNKLTFKLDLGESANEVFVYNLQRKKVILKNDQRGDYSVAFNSNNQTIKVEIHAGIIEDIIEDFQYAFDRLEEYLALIRPKFLFQ